MLEISKLNSHILSEILAKVPLVSMHLDHEHIKSSLLDYDLSGEENLEMQFVIDLFTLKTDEIIEKWYGGKENALNQWSTMMNEFWEQARKEWEKQSNRE